jgi:ATPase subunit of ABC transporter with duplicated ATPase domains
VSLQRLATTRLGKQVYELDDVSLSLGTKSLLDGVTWNIGPGDRIGLVGANGAGKSTLLRVLTGALPPDGGRVQRGQTVRPAFLSQELRELPLHLRVLEAVEEVARRVTLGDRELSAAQFAEVFGFSGARLWTPVGDLSGGEKRRLQLMRLLAAEPNVLLMDEPTNDLDIDTLAALEDLLDTWPGTVIVASHDRYLIERVCDTVVAMYGDGKVRDLPGGIDEYLATLGEPTVEPGARVAPQQQAKALAVDGMSAGELRAAKKELARLERLMNKLEQREAGLHEQLATHATDYEKVATLDAELRAVRDERSATEEAWLELAERVPEV